MFETPILFIIFNRPDVTRRVFERIREQKPRYLYIAADGPRQEVAADEELCRQARLVAEQVDWDCELKTLFREKNLGCGLAVSGAISWFFEQVEQGIILEDDCLPDPSFFGFCESLLLKYKDEKSISLIGAMNYQPAPPPDGSSYYFSIYTHVWGWATWKRVWELYDYTLNTYNRDWVKKHFPDVREQGYWNGILEGIQSKNAINTWDYQLFCLNMKHDMLSIIPEVSLVRNLGFYQGTHITGEVEDFHRNMRFGSITNLKHPPVIARDRKADQYMFEEILSPVSRPLGHKVRAAASQLKKFLTR